MKKFLLLIGFAIATMATADAQVLKINIFSPIVKTLNVQYEQVLSGTSSFQLGAFYTGYSTSGTGFKGFGITPEYRFYLSESEAPAGVYVAPFVRYQSFTLTEDSSNSEGTLSTFGGGLILGKQWVFKERVVLDMFIGPAYSSGSVKVKSGTDSFDTGAFDGFGIRTGLCLGVKF